MSSTAEVTYRLYVPFGWFAITYCDIEFFGEDATRLNNKWNNIKYAKREEMDRTIEVCKEKISENKKQIENLRSKYKSLRRWWTPWHTKAEKEVLSEIETFSRDIQHQNDLITKCKDDRNYSACELVRKAHDMLSLSGFRMVSHSKNGEECCDDIEIWEK